MAASADVTGRGEIETRRYTQGSGDKQKTYYDADVYRVDAMSTSPSTTCRWSPPPSAATWTQANTNNIINTILPFDTKNAVKWNASYLRGFTSEKRDRDVAHLLPRLEDQLLSIGARRSKHRRAVTIAACAGSRNVSTVHGTRWVSMYLPVWLYSYHQPGSNGGMLHYIAVNGRTGETMGSVPVQQWKLLQARSPPARSSKASHSGWWGQLMSDDSGLWLLALGPAGAMGLYWGLYRYYRNTDKSHAFERETAVDAQPVTGSDDQVGTNNGTQATSIDGNNVSAYLQARGACAGRWRVAASACSRWQKMLCDKIPPSAPVRAVLAQPRP